MPPRLSSILVRDGLVSVKRMEHAFQRQVIYGGCLDTILLEMNLLTEERLVQYLSLATGLPPATRSETDVFEARAIEHCPSDVARIYRVVPLCFEEGALRVLVHDPVDLTLLEDLANELDVPVQPLVVPEYRFHIAFARVFGGSPDARFSTLARRTEEENLIAPVGKARSVIINDLPAEPGSSEPRTDSTMAAVRVQPSSAGRSNPTTQIMASGAVARRVEEIEQARAAAKAQEQQRAASQGQNQAQGHDESRRATTARDLIAQQDTAPVSVLANARPEPQAAASTIPGGSSPAAVSEPVVPLTKVKSPSPQTVAPAAQPAPAVVESRPQPAQPGREPGAVAGVSLTGTPLEPAHAIMALADAEERDIIFGLLLRAIHSRARYTALLTVQGDAALGRLAIAEGRQDREQIAQILIPLDDPSPFRAVARSAAPHLGPLTMGGPELIGMLERMGISGPVSVLLLPVVLRNRVVAIAVGHNGDRPMDVGALAELLPVARQAAEALSRLIVKSKRRATTGSAASATGPGEPEAGIPAGTLATADTSPAPALPRPPELPEQMPEQPPAQGRRAAPRRTNAITTQMPARIIDSVIDAIESDDPELADEAIPEALLRLDETIEALREHFPGKLTVDRYELESGPIPAAQHGPILALVIRMGTAAADLLVEKMRDPSRDTRYYATLCVAELRPRNAIEALVERLFDNDYGVRSTAIAALAGYPAAALESALVLVRQVLRGGKPDQVQAAANALAKLGDVHAVPELIEVMAEDDRNAEHARLALVQLTKQDLGTSARKWRAWWSKSQGQSRIEWLIEGLAHKDENIRRSAVEELRHLTGEYFGFHHDLPKKEREQARLRWVNWWKQSGRQRFLRGGNSES